MKLFLRLTPVLLAVFVLTGCTKVVVVADSSLAGSWVLTDVSQKDAYGWYSVVTGLENGVFDFYNDGTVRYTDNHVSMQGNWYVQTTIGGYYDEYGNYYSDSHQSLEIHLSDYYSDNYADLYFNDVRIYANRFVATNYDGTYVERYRFSRY